LIGLVQDSNGHSDKTIAYFREAIYLAHSIGANQIFIDDAAYVSELMKKTAKVYSDEFVSDIYRQLPARNLNRQTGVSYQDLTAREKEVIQLAASGLSTQEIGERLFISTTTAKKHLANVYMKTGVHSRIQAISRLREEGVLPQEKTLDE
jgi:LuxR family maltose regulon positive regulatory protein